MTHRFTSHTARELFRRALTRRILPVRIESETYMDLIAVDIDGTLASNRDQMDKYLTGFFASNRRFFKAIRNATVNVEIADRVREIAADTGAEVVVITGRDGTYMKELNQFIARAGLEPKHVFAKPGNDGSNSPAWKDSVIESLIADGNRIIHAFEDTDHEVYLRRGIPVTWVAPIRDYIGEWHYESIDIDPVAWAAEQREKEAARERQKRRLAEGVLAHQKAEAKERQANVAA